MISFLFKSLKRDFYCNILGFKELERPKFKSKGYWIQLENTTFHLIECPEDDKNSEYLKNNPKRRETRGWAALPGSGDHFAFKVNDTNAASEKLRIVLMSHEFTITGKLRIFMFGAIKNA